MINALLDERIPGQSTIDLWEIASRLAMVKEEGGMSRGFACGPAASFDTVRRGFLKALLVVRCDGEEN